LCTRFILVLIKSDKLKKNLLEGVMEHGTEIILGKRWLEGKFPKIFGLNQYQ